MKLSTHLVQQTVAQLKEALPIPPVKTGRPILRIGDRILTALAPRCIFPLSCTVKRPNWVTLRSLTSSGICFSDSSYWLDGEQFLLPVAPGSDQRHRAVLCSVTHWEPVMSGVFRVTRNLFATCNFPVPMSRGDAKPFCRSRTDVIRKLRSGIQELATTRRLRCRTASRSSILDRVEHHFHRAQLQKRSDRRRCRDECARMPMEPFPRDVRSLPAPQGQLPPPPLLQPRSLL